MNKRNKDAYRWLKNRLKIKYKIPHATTVKVLGAIADLEWDWSNSKYDMFGLQLEEILYQIGKRRRPKNYDEFTGKPAPQGEVEK